jgi:hypothetical protein
MKIPITFCLNLVYGNVVLCRYEADCFQPGRIFPNKNVSRNHPASQHRKLKLKTGVCQPLLMVRRVFSLLESFEVGNMVYSVPSSYDRPDIRTTWVTTKILVLTYYQSLELRPE